MGINIDDIDELIAKLNEAKIALNDIENIVGKCEYLTAKDVAKILKVSDEAARAYMNRPDFPALKVGKGLRVNSWAFLIYNMQARK